MIIEQIFGVKKPIIGSVELHSLPGAPRYNGSLKEVLDRALADAQTFAQCGVDGLILENYGDYPFYPETVAPETVAALTVIAHELVRRVGLPMGINVLRNSWKAGLAIALVVGARFIRVNVLTDVLVTDQGLVTGPAAQLARYRHFLGAKEVKVFADVDCKHGAPLARRPLEVVARDTAYRGLADVLILTGRESPEPPRQEDIETVKGAVPDRPVIIGSGLSPSSVTLLRYADGSTLGWWARKDGLWSNPVDPQIVSQIMEKVREMREQI